MLEILFSLQFVWIALLIVGLSILLALLCAYLQRQLLAISIGEWLLEHIYCPLIRVLLLMTMAFLIFPLIVESARYSDLARLFMRTDFLINMLNILFVTSLLVTFIPGIRHPALSIPVLGCIAISLIFLHQVMIPNQLEINWAPPFAIGMRIFVIVCISYFCIRWITHHLSLWLDYRFNITGSKPLVRDTSYVIFQIPVLLAYGHSLHTQTVTVS